MTNDEIKKLLREHAPFNLIATPQIVVPSDKADFINKCGAIISQLLKQNEMLLTVVGHYALLEANDNGDSEEPACKALWDLGYTKEHPYTHTHNTPTLMDELNVLKKQNEIMREALEFYSNEMNFLNALNDENIYESTANNSKNFGYFIGTKAKEVLKQCEEIEQC